MSSCDYSFFWNYSRTSLIRTLKGQSEVSVLLYLHGGSCNTNISTLQPFSGTALAWFKSYLTSRQQFVKGEEGMSSKRPLLRGEPQRSVLGPLLYLVYTAPRAIMGSWLCRLLISSKSMTYYTICTMMTRNYIFPSILVVFADLDETKLRVERCVVEIDLWMCKNLLKLSNQDKTELVVQTKSWICSGLRWVHCS